MPLVPIPPWNAEGLIPPTDVTNPVSANRSPYIVSLADLALRFSTSLPRLEFSEVYWLPCGTSCRRAYRGFPMDCGSFTENIEVGSRKDRLTMWML